MDDFWRSSGFNLLERDGDGNMAVTEAFLRAYLRRPEMEPVAGACEAEIALHKDLLADPRLSVEAGRIAALADADARENYEVVLAFRDLLIEAGTVEGCYLGLFQKGRVTVPPLFIHQMTRVILRNILEDCADPIQLRAAELFFRGQTVGLHEGAILLADEETVEMANVTGGFGNLGRLLAEAQIPTQSVELDVLNEDNGALYWQRNEDHDTVLDFSFGRAGQDRLCRVLEAWIDHFTGAGVTIEPLEEISDERWSWHVGLDAEATNILNDLYEGKELTDERRRQLITLFRLEFKDPALVRPDLAGKPVYLGLAMDGANLLRLKPQNLLVNLPLAGAA